MFGLMGLQFKISYKKGAENCTADALSRVNHVMTIQNCSEIQPVSQQEVIDCYLTDADAQRRLRNWQSAAR
jgi:hypothetical protein